MRSFDERKTEIFRRSEERIKERKRKRNRLLAVCIPLVLCVSLFALRERADGKSELGDQVNENLDLDEIHSNSVTASGTGVQVLGGQVSHYYTVPSDVTKITGLIDGITAEQEEMPEAMVPESEDMGVAAPDGYQDYSRVEYTIIITTGDGTRREYILVAGQLTNCSTLEEYELSVRELTELKDALGIT